MVVSSESTVRRKLTSSRKESDILPCAWMLLDTKSSPATRRQKKRPATRKRTTQRPAARQPTTHLLPPPPPPPTPPRPPRTPREHAPPAFIVPDPINLDFPYPDDDEAAGDV
ncbi:hypothetical protein SeLEV6574_g06427, partial [Synchytrium endobioticum]